VVPCGYRTSGKPSGGANGREAVVFDFIGCQFIDFLEFFVGNDCVFFDVSVSDVVSGLHLASNVIVNQGQMAICRVSFFE
jgi:hypothetical protein